MNKEILIADNDPVICSMLTNVLSDVIGGAKAVIAGSGREALDIIRKRNICLVIAEITLPDMDGIRLLEHIRTNYSRIPVFLMTAFGTSEIQKKINEIGCAGYFEKPLKIEHLKKCVQKEINTDIEGKINGISLPSYLQMLEKEQKTCTLFLSSGKKNGRLYFLRGGLVRAETGVLKNEEAAYEIISWAGTVIRVKAGCSEKRGEINASLKDVLAEGLKKRIKPPGITASANARKTAGPPADPSNSIKKTSSAKKKNTKQLPHKKQVPALDRLKNMLQDTGDIIEYAIFNEKGSVLAQHSKSDDILKCKASSYVKFSGHLNDLVNGGKLRYIVLTKEDNIRYIMFIHKKTRITVAAKPEFRTEEFLKKIAA